MSVSPSRTPKAPAPASTQGRPETPALDPGLLADGTPAPEGPKGTPKRKPARALRLVNVADVEFQPSRWLWYPYIPAGKLTLIEGDPSIGKSWLSCALAKAVAGGEPLPGQDPTRKKKPQRVLLVSAEDGIGDTLGPRLQSMGANLSNIDYVTESFTLDVDGVRMLEETLRSRAITIVFIDPIVAYLGGKMDMNKANEVREVMAALARAAEATGCAVVVIRHLRKASADNKLYRGIGSIDFTAAARSVISCSWDKKGTTRIFRHIKCNLAPEGPPLAYDITRGEEILAEETPDGEVTQNIWSTGRFEWITGWEEEEPEAPQKVSTKPKALAKAEQFLIEFLSQGPRPAMEVIRAAEEVGISEKTLKRAKKGVAISQNDGTMWVWALMPQMPSEGVEQNV